MPKKPPVFIENIRITEAGARGKGVGRTPDGKVVFVSGAVPGDTCTVRLLKSKKQFAEGNAVKITSASPYRTEPACSHFGTCGGCKWQNLSYDKQLYFKEEEVKNQLLRHAKLEVEEFIPILPANPIYYYRNKVEFSFSADRWRTEEEMQQGIGEAEPAVGFHAPGRWDKVLYIQHCHLQPDPSNAIRLAVHEYAQKNGISYFHPRNQTGHLRTMMLRNTLKGEWMLALQCGEDHPVERMGLLNHLIEKFPMLTSVFYAVNTKNNDSWYGLEPVLFYGEDHLLEEMPSYWPNKQPLKFKVGPKSFYQTNANQAYELYKVALDFAEVQPGEVVYDLYSGTGTIGLFMAQQAEKVIGLEGVPEAVEDAKLNAALNGIGHASFFAGDMKDLLKPEFLEQHGTPGVLITDPPREGMHPKVVDLLANSQIPRIVYVSCNPATQARDLALLSAQYKVVKSQAVDMFPHTFHVENVVLLIKK